MAPTYFAPTARLLEVLHDLLGHEVDLPGVVGDRAEHEVFEPRLPQVVDPRVDAVDAAYHVALLQVLVAPVRAHGAKERRLRLRHGLVEGAVPSRHGHAPELR